MLNWISKPKEHFKFHKLSPTQIIIFGFICIISIGALLLTLPISSKEGVFTNLLTAYFTATSATCVTGLVLVDTSLYWSSFGKGVILLLIQIGGLGFMSMAMMFSMLLKRRVSPKERIVFVQSMNLFSGEKMFSFIKYMLSFTFAFEGIGAFLLSFRFIPIFGFWNGIAKSIFHSISAFCNAGFDILGNFSGKFSSLEYFASDAYVNIIIAALIVCGGLGFVVWYDIYKKIKERKKLCLYSKMVLTITAILIISGTIIFLIAEWDNPDTMGGSSPGIKLLKSFFMSVTCRTAGFATISVDGLKDVSKVLSMVLMFIGGSSGSTAGGIKTVTIGIVVIAIFQIIKGNKDVNIRKRRIETEIVSRAFVLLTIASLALLICSFILSFTEQNKGYDFINIAFEAFSAFGTVGLSAGITPFLGNVSQIVIMALMFFGRVGIITITYALLIGFNKDKQNFSYPKANILIG